MATCMYCGAQIADGLKFCTSCGAALPVEAPLEQAIVDATVQQPEQQPGTFQPDAAQPYQQPSFEQPAGQQPGAQQPYQQPQFAAPAAQPAVNDSGSIVIDKINPLEKVPTPVYEVTTGAGGNVETVEEGKSAKVNVEEGYRVAKITYTYTDENWDVQERTLFSRYDEDGNDTGDGGDGNVIDYENEIYNIIFTGPGSNAIPLDEDGKPNPGLNKREKKIVFHVEFEEDLKDVTLATSAKKEDGSAVEINENSPLYGKVTYSVEGKEKGEDGKIQGKQGDLVKVAV